MEVHNPDNAAVHEPSEEPINETAPEADFAVIPDAERFAPPGHGKKAGSHKKAIAGLIIVLLIAAAAGYWFMKHKAKQPAAAQASAAQTAPKPSAQTTSGTTTYTAKGQDLNLSFAYPANWSATPASGTDTSDQPITITSPFVSMTSANGQTVTSKVVVAIRPVTSDVGELSANNPTEALDSTQFAYTSPTPNQHQYFYVSYVHFSNGQKVPGAFEEVFVTGVQQLLKDYPVQSIGTDPIISASLYQCTTQDCTGKGAIPLSITLTTWQSSDVTKQAQAILSSLQFH